jgi:anti-anti-sigma factor
MSLTVTLTVDGSTALLTLAGELDAVTAPAFFERITDAAERGPRRLVVDMGQLSYLSSAGLRGLVFARQKMGEAVEMILAGAREGVLETIRLTGFDRSVVLVDAYPG